MKTNIFIPSKINVGFQNRKDTYTGKLAYVIYFDEKGKLRKETSWQNWRDKNIPNEIFENEPIEGFVLNKKLVATTTVGIHDKLTQEYMTLEDLNLKLLFQIYYGFLKTVIVLKEKVLKDNLFMVGMVKNLC